MARAEPPPQGVLGTRKALSRTNSEVLGFVDRPLRHKACGTAGKPLAMCSGAEVEYSSAPYPPPLPRGLISRLSMLELTRLAPPILSVAGGSSASLHCYPGLSNHKLRRTRSTSSLDCVPAVPTTEQALVEAALGRLASRSNSPSMELLGCGRGTRCAR